MPNGQDADKPRLNRRFWYCWAAITASSIGDGITFVALPLLATGITDDARAIAMLRTAALIPWLFLAIFSGVLVDRVSRRAAMGWMELLRAALLAVLLVLTWNDLDTLWPLYLLVFVLGAAQTVFESAAQAIIPEVVDDAALERAHGLTSSGQNVGLVFVGPPLGGLLFVVDPSLPFVIHVATFLVSAALLWMMRGVAKRAVAQSAATSARFLVAMREGVSAVTGDRAVRTIGMLVGIVSFCLGMAYGIAVLYSTVELGMSGVEFGVFTSVGAVGGIVAGVASSEIRRWLGTVLAARLSICTVPVTLIALGVAQWVGVAMAANVVLGFAAGIWLVVSVSVRQRLVPAELHGRIASIFRMLSLGMQSFGMIVGGYVAHFYGLRAPFLVGGLLALVPVCWLAMQLTKERLAAAEPRKDSSPQPS